MSSAYHIDTLVEMAYGRHDVETLFLGGFKPSAIQAAISRLNTMVGYNQQYYDKLCSIITGEQDNALLMAC